MVDTARFFQRLSRNEASRFGENPSKEEIREVVQELKAEGLCGRRIAEQRLGPAFIASDVHGQREIELLDEVLDEEYADLDLCVRDRREECSRLRGGCTGDRSE